MKGFSKKFLSIFMSLLMILSLGIVAFAENEDPSITDPPITDPPITDPVTALTVSTQTVYAEGEVTLSVSLTDNVGFNEFLLYVEFDADVLTAKTVAKDEVLTGNTLLSQKKSGVVICKLNKLDADITANGALFTIVFTAANKAAEVAVKAGLGTDGYFKNLAGEDVTVTFVDGAVSVTQYALLAVSSLEAEEDTDFTVAVTAERNPGIKSFKLSLKFDNTKLAIKSIARGSATPSSVGTLSSSNIDTANSNGTLIMQFIGTDTITDINAELFKVTFSAKADIGDCNLTLTLDKGTTGYVKDADDNAVELQTKGGAITIYEYIPVFNFSLSRLDEVADNELSTALIEIDDNPGFTYFRLKIKYDASFLTPDSVVTFKRDSEGSAIDLELANLGTLRTNNLASANGEIIIEWEKTDATKDFKRDGELIAVTFFVKDNTPDRTLDLTFDKTYGSFRNAKGQDCKVAFTDGYFTIVNAPTGWWQNLLLFWDDLVLLFTDQMPLAVFFAKWFS